MRQPCRRSGLVGATIGSNVYTHAYDRDGRIDDADAAKARDGKTTFRF